MRLEMRCIWRKDGTSFFVQYTSTPIERDNEVVGAVITFSDITERKRAEKRLQESEANLAQAQQITRLGSWEYLPKENKVFWSDETYRILGFTPRQFVPTFQDWMDLVHPEDRTLIQENMARLFRGEQPRDSVEFRIVRTDGKVRFIQGQSSAEYDETSELIKMFGTMQDITERKRVEDELRRSERSLVKAQRVAHLGSWEMDLTTGDVRWSDELFRIFGHAPQSFIPIYETHYLNAIHPEDRERVEQAINEAFEGKSSTVDYRIVRPDGEIRHVHSDGEVLFDEGGEEPVEVVGTVQDITERKRAEERLHYQAFHDKLTDLPNRQLFMDRLEQALRHTRRRKKRKVAVLFMDLNNFKVVNDSLGHDAGDFLLVMVGERLRRSLRPEDTLARFGGDEFTVLVEDVENPEDAVRVAERIIEALREPFVVENRELFLKPSIGIALGEARQKTVQDLVRDADTAMYQAKGRSEDYQVFEPNMYEQALRRLKLESDLRRAIEDEEFVVCYQPIVDLETGEAWGVEALVRWEHPEHQGLLAPSQFIPVAEEAGLVVPMGRWVLEEACRQGVKWQQEHPHASPLFISVNLSAKQLQHPDVAETVEEILKKTGFDAHYLSLDITETLYIKAVEGNTAALDKLKKMGVCISIDDFGTGYSSLAYLKRLPAETLKIDKSFIKGIGEDLEDTAIVRMVIELAHILGMKVVAEGVESEAQAEQLKEMGCDRGQGFYFAEPLPPRAASEFLT